MNNLRRFNTEAEYQQASLNYPAVSWVVSGDTVHYDKTEPTPPTPTPVLSDNIAFAFSAIIDGTDDIVLYNCAASIDNAISAITLNGVAVENPSACTVNNYDYTSGETYVLEYFYNYESTYITTEFSGELGGGWGSEAGLIDFYVPSGIIQIDSLPTNINNLVVKATTPPYVESGGSTIGYTANIYVPDSAVNTYKSDGSWGELSANIHPISEYQGILPI